MLYRRYNFLTRALSPWRKKQNLQRLCLIFQINAVIIGLVMEIILILWRTCKGVSMK